MSMFFVHGTCANHVPATPITALSNRDVDTIITAGTSIENQSNASEDTAKFAQAYIENEYSRTVEILDIAVSGSQIGDLVRAADPNNATDVSRLLSSRLIEYSDKTNVTVCLNHGFNDANGGTFLSKSQSVRDQLISDMTFVVDFCRNAGWHVVQGTPTASWVGQDYTNADPTQPVDTVGTYDYIRDWIVPIMQSYAPAYLRNDENGVLWPVSDSYNVIRNFYPAFRDVEDQNDYTHPGFNARAVHLLTMIDAAMLTAQGQLPAQVTMRDYNATYPLASANDMVFGFNLASNVSSSAANINWITAPNTSFEGGLHLSAAIDTSGSAVSGVELFSYADIVDNQGQGNTVDANNDTATLENNYLLSGALGLGDGFIRAMHTMVKGLQPLRRYTAEFVASARNNNNKEQYVFLHDGNQTEDIILDDAGGANPQSRIVSRELLSDHLGRAYFATRPHSNNVGGDAYMSGIRIRSTGVSNTQPISSITGSTSAANRGSVPLQGSVTDPDTGDTHTYTWRVISGSGTLSAANTQNVTVSGPSIDTAQSTVLGLIVNDGTVNSAEVQHTIAFAAAVVTPPTSSPTITLSNMPNDSYEAFIRSLTSGQVYKANQVTVENNTATSELDEPASTVWIDR